MKDLRDDEIRQSVRKVYGDIAKSDTVGCNYTASSCCDSGNKSTVQDISAKLGYSGEEVSNVPEGANMGLGCGNPQAIASLKAAAPYFAFRLLQVGSARSWTLAAFAMDIMFDLLCTLLYLAQRPWAHGPPLDHLLALTF